MQCSGTISAAVKCNCAVQQRITAAASNSGLSSCGSSLLHYNREHQ
jgi:hypothetical protein